MAAMANPRPLSPKAPISADREWRYTIGLAIRRGDDSLEHRHEGVDLGTINFIAEAHAAEQDPRHAK